MKSIRYNTFIWLIAVLCLANFGCGKSLTDTNVNPNSVGAEQINPAYIMTQTLGQTATQISAWALTGNATQSLISEMMQYTQRDYLEYSVTNTFNWESQDWGYRDFYLPLANASYLSTMARNSQDSAFLRGVSLVLTSYWYGFYASAWGDVPYSEAIKGPKGILRPKLDKQQDVFKGILQDLETANEVLSNIQVSSSTKFSDILYNGDPLKWRAFANSLHLRFLMRLSEKSADMQTMGVDVKAEFNRVASDPVKYPLITNSGANAAIGFPGTAALDSWPMGSLKTPDKSEFYRKKPAATIVNFLKNNEDPRLTVWFRQVDVQTLIRDKGGDRVILKDSDGKVRRYFKTDHADIDTSLYVGLGIAMPDPNSSNGKDQGQITEASSLDPSIYSSAASNPFVSYLSDIWGEDSNPLVKAVLISAAEVNFTLAEAVVRGWISGSALDYYKEGIKASMTQYGIATGDRKVYNTQTHQMDAFDLSTFLSDATTTFDNATNKIEAIITQKWAADFGTADMDAWFNWRRTAYPNLGKNVISGPKGEKIPVRFIYGSNPKNFNGDNVNIAIQSLQPAVDDQWSKIWLLQGTGKPW